MGGNSEERAQGQSELQVSATLGCETVADFATLFGAQQLRAVAALDLPQQDFFAELEPDLRHWQLPPFPQLPQQALPEVSVKQPWAEQDAVQSTD